MEAKFYKVGGYIRDKLLGIKSKDIDFAVEAESYEAMRQAVLNKGCKIFVDKPEYLTIRARHPELGAVDYVLCRKDGEYSDGRRPDEVIPGNLYDDLARRDFTMNAIAEDEDGIIIDPFKGQFDIARKVIRCVGDAEKRFSEDSLRLVRAIRFSVTKSMLLDKAVRQALKNPVIVNQLRNVSIERVSDELYKGFKFNTLAMLRALAEYPLVEKECFSLGKLRLEPTLRNMK